MGTDNVQNQGFKLLNMAISKKYLLLSADNYDK